MDLINYKLNIEIQKLCLHLEKKYNIDHKNLVNLWFNKGEAYKGEGDDVCTSANARICETTDQGIKFNQTYNSDTIKIMNVLFLISDEVFGKIENNDVKPLTDEDEKICISYGYKIMAGCLKDISIY